MSEVKRGRRNTSDEPRIGLPKTVTNEKMVYKKVSQSPNKVKSNKVKS